MDEYITRNNAISAVCLGCNQQFSDEPCELSDCTIRWSIMALPTADVAPRAEVEKIFEEIEKIRAKEIRKCETLREKENDASKRKYWEGGEYSLRQLSYWLAELKKKYTEDEK